MKNIHPTLFFSTRRLIIKWTNALKGNINQNGVSQPPLQLTLTRLLSPGQWAVCECWAAVLGNSFKELTQKGHPSCLPLLPAACGLKLTWNIGFHEPYWIKRWTCGDRSQIAENERTVQLEESLMPDALIKPPSQSWISYLATDLF